MSVWLGTWVAVCVVIGAGIGQQQAWRHHHGNPRAHHHESLPSQMERAPLNHESRAYPQGGTICPNCLLNQELHQQKQQEREHQQPYHELRLEAIKRQILSRLGLSAKPNVSSTVPRRVVMETLNLTEEAPRPAHTTTTGLPWSDPAEDYIATTSEIIAFAEPGSTLNGQTLLEFPHPGGSEADLRVKSATLWVHVDPRYPTHIDRNVTLWVFRVRAHVANATRLSGKEFDSYTEMSSSLGIRLWSGGRQKADWQKLDVTGTVSGWYSGRRERLRLLVDCSGCGKVVAPTLLGGGSRGRAEEGRRPFLVVHTEPGAGRRVRRRALDCSGANSGQCCKQSFYVSFKQLGWDDWVIAPSGYFANYCRGDCSGHRTPDTFLNHYTHVIEEYRKTDRLAGLQPCCAPLRFSSASLIYYGPDMNIIKRDLPKMVVEECGCP